MKSSPSPCGDEEADFGKNEEITKDLIYDEWEIIQLRSGVLRISCSHEM